MNNKKKYLPERRWARASSWLVLFLIIAAFLLLPVGAVVAADSFAGGSGTEADPYLIVTAAQLNLVRDNLSSHFKLAANIHLGSYDPLHTGGQGWEPIGTDKNPFQGSLNGDGHRIAG